MVEVNNLEYWSALGNSKRVAEALAANSDVNGRGEHGYTALHAAAMNGHVAVIRLLVEHGADLNAQLSTGETPLALAILGEHTEAAILLREIGTDS